VVEQVELRAQQVHRRSGGPHSVARGAASSEENQHRLEVRRVKHAERELDVTHVPRAVEPGQRARRTPGVGDDAERVRRVRRSESRQGRRTRMERIGA
jgi:hypothetical protein